MDRPLRAFQPAAVPLEGRILLARVHAPLPPTVACRLCRHHHRSPSPPPPSPTPPSRHDASLGSVGSWALRVPRGSRSRSFSKAAKRPYGCAEIPDGPLQVQVATDPSSPAVGVNLPAVNQTVTIAAGQPLAKTRLSPP